MSIQILVRDSGNKPVKNVEVFIKWKDGFSKVYTDDSGSADVDIDGYIVYTKVYDSERRHEIYTKDVPYITHKMK